MLTERQITDKFNNGEKLVITVIGDSTSSGIAANVGPNKWVNGVEYAAVNQPNAYPNLTAGSPFFVNLDTYPSKAQQDNLAIPSAVRQLRTLVEAENNASIVLNYSIPGWDAQAHITSGTVGIIAELEEKPDLCIINLGINSAKNRKSQYEPLKQIVKELMLLDIFVVLAQPNNIGVTGSPEGAWSQTELPNNWYAQDYWPTTVNEIKTIHAELKTGFVNVGTDDLKLDITKLYDPFHPNAEGFNVIANKYLRWLQIGTLKRNNGAMIKTANGKSYFQPWNGNAAFRYRVSNGDTVSIPLCLKLDELRVNSGTKVSTFE
ncbi:SGNH/GDSL hydrolase family protein [Shewanella sp.]|uniref:SGNH/GDSL hydrolase family protein n=1 Tax=Shewanella sp. TaxID=50422 RepID=UPI004053E8FC